MPVSGRINEPTDKKKADLDQFDEMRANKACRQSISPEELNAALSTITDFLRTNWTTGGSRRLQHFAFHFSAPVGYMVDSVAGYFAGSGLLHEEVKRGQWTKLRELELHQLVRATRRLEVSPDTANPEVRRDGSLAYKITRIGLVPLFARRQF
jgi:hypothetical protein